MCCSCEATLKLSFANAMKWNYHKNEEELFSFQKLIADSNAVVLFSCVVEIVSIHMAENVDYMLVLSICAVSAYNLMQNPMGYV